MVFFWQVSNIKLLMRSLTFLFHTESLNSMCILHLQHIAIRTCSISIAQSPHVLMIPVLDLQVWETHPKLFPLVITERDEKLGGGKVWTRTSNFLKLSFFCILWIFHTRHVFYINFAILYKGYYKWGKDYLSERLRGWREIVRKAFVMIKHCPNMLVYLCPSFCQKGWKGARRDTWNITWVTKVKSGGKKRKKNKGGGLQWGWNEAG